MQNKDEKLLTAVAHWSYRFVSNGVPLSDFNDVCNSTKKWDDWCVEWEKKGHIHAALGDCAIKNGFNLSAADHYNTAAVCCHFGKFLFVQDPDQMLKTHKYAVEYHKRSMKFVDPTIR